MDGEKGTLDSFCVEEVYSWRDDIMEITRRIVHETDEARLNNIAEHFEVDLSEIREFLKMKQRQKRKPKTNADRIRSMTDEDLATYLDDMQGLAYINGFDSEPIRFYPNNYRAWLDWLRQEGE